MRFDARPETGNAALTRAEKEERGSLGWILGRSGAMVVGCVGVDEGSEAGRFRFLEERTPSSRPEGSLRPVMV